MAGRLRRRAVVIVFVACSVAVVGLLVAYAFAARQHSAPLSRVATQLMVKPGDVRVNDWLHDHGRVTSVEVLDNAGVLVRTANELIVCRADLEVRVLRRHDGK